MMSVEIEVTAQNLDKESTVMSVEIEIIAQNLDKVFYFVSPENLQLKSKKQDELAAMFADRIGASLYGIRSGPKVQDSKVLLTELVSIGIEKFEIVYFEKEISEYNTNKSTVIFLGHDDKADFFRLLDCESSSNSGLVCQKVLFDKEHEGSNEHE